MSEQGQNFRQGSARASAPILRYLCLAPLNDRTASRDFHSGQSGRIVRDSVIGENHPRRPAKLWSALLETFVLALMTSLAVVVLLGVIFRKAGASLVWYDEVASILLAWLTVLRVFAGGAQARPYRFPETGRGRAGETAYDSADRSRAHRLELLSAGGLGRLAAVGSPRRNGVGQSSLDAGGLGAVGHSDRRDLVCRFGNNQYGGSTAGFTSSARGRVAVTLLLLFLGLIVLILLDIPIAVALGVVAVVAMAASGGFDALLNIGPVLFSGATKFTLIAIPLFILAGAIMNVSGISRRLIAFASSLIGFVKGGLAMVTIATVAVLCRDFGFGGGRRGRARVDPDPGDAAQRLPQGLCGGGHVLGGDLGRHHSAFHPHDSIRRDVGQLGCRVIHRRDRAGPARRAGHDDRDLRDGAPPQLSRRRGFRTPACRLHRQGRRLGPLAAGHHPRRHLQRLGHRHRRRRPCGRRRGRDRRGLSIAAWTALTCAPP